MIIKYLVSSHCTGMYQMLTDGYLCTGRVCRIPYSIVIYLQLLEFVSYFHLVSVARGWFCLMLIIVS